jgi:hypothetical protein
LAAAAGTLARFCFQTSSTDLTGMERAITGEPSRVSALLSMV